MSKRTGGNIALTAVGAASLLYFSLAAPALGQVQINLVPGSVASGKVAVDVVLVSGGASVAGMQNDIIFDNTIVKLNTAADCKLNNAISDNPPNPDDCIPDANNNVAGPCKALGRQLKACGASPQPAGCPADAGTNISLFRGLLAASTNALNKNPIPDGTLYTCTFTVVDDTKFPTTLTNSNVIVSDPNGAQLANTPGNGTIGGTGEPTATPGESTPTATVGVPTPTPTGIQINLVPSPVASGKVAVDVVLFSAGASVAGMQNDIIFDNTIVKLNTAADCKLNTAISDNPPNPDDCIPDANNNVAGPCKALGRQLKTCGASPQPAGCPADAGTNISLFRGLLAASTNALNKNPIPDGTLYTCTFTVVDGTKLPTTLTNSNVIVSDPDGAQLPNTAGNGIVGGGVVPPTATAPVGATATPTTAVATATHTPVVAAATSTPTATRTAGAATATSAPSGGGGADEDGCQIGSRSTGSSAWLLLFSAIGLVAVRRRRG